MKKSIPEKMQPPELPEKVLTEIQTLKILLSTLEKHCLVFALYRTVAGREAVIEQLKQQMPEGINEIFLSPGKRAVLPLIEQECANLAPSVRAVFVFDLEETFPDSLGSLNLQRDLLAEIPRVLVFWIREFALREIADKAPDFWAWRSEVFDFRTELPEHERVVSEELTRSDFFPQNRTDLERRISLYRELLSSTATKDDLIHRAYLLHLLGFQYHNLGNFEEALQFYEQSLKIWREIGIIRSEGMTLNNIGQIYLTRGDIATALNYLQQSLKIQQNIGDKKGESTTLNNISQIYHNRGDYSEALKYLRQSLKIQQELGNKAGEATILNNISGIYYLRGDYEKALTYLDRSLNIQQKIGDKKGEGITLNNISQIYYSQRDTATALNYLKQSLKIHIEIGNIADEAVTGNNLARIFVEQGDWQQAVRLLRRVVEIETQTGHPDLPKHQKYLQQLEVELKSRTS